MTIKYLNPARIVYYSPRYDKTVTVPEGWGSDGASGAVDIYSQSWWCHDMLCVTWKWDDGSPCTNLQASKILHDILIDEGRWFRARSWFVATWVFGPIRRLFS